MLLCLLAFVLVEVVLQHILVDRYRKWMVEEHTADR